MRSKYFIAVKWLGGSALVALVIGLVFPFISQGFPEVTRNSVLIHATPFFAIFISILLVFILLIVLVALRFNGKIPYRTYRPVEMTIIAGIISGVVFLFQPFHIVAYRYGFLLLLASTLGFILWSHVISAGAKADLHLPRFSIAQQGIGAAAAVAVIVLLTQSAAAVNSPQSPYGVRQRVWDSYTPERQAEIATQATSDFQNLELPFLVILNAFPAAIVYFVAREATGALFNGKQRDESPAVPVKVI